MLLFSKFINQP